MLEEQTITLGDKLQFFANTTCSKFKTFELFKEAEKCQCHKAKKLQVENSDTHTTTGSTRQRKTFNMDTYKHHALRDYTETIRTYGTCNSYSTELVWLLWKGVFIVSNFLIYSRVNLNIVQLRHITLVQRAELTSSK
jgi:hypothetical protein